jgi:predicted AAA+ superfamily ATPase
VYCFYFWRDSIGDEIDLLIETGKKLIPVEIKLSSTPKPDFAKILFKWQNICIDKIEHANIVFGGSEEVQLKNIRYLLWNQLKNILGD